MASLIRFHKPWVWAVLVAAVALVAGVKELRPIFFGSGPPLALNDQPAILFFNNDEGCECIVPLYQKADAAIATWPAERRGEIAVHRIVLDDRPDLQRQYDVERAPMLLIVDGDGQELWREWGVASNPEVFDLGEVEARIAALGWGDS